MPRSACAAWRSKYEIELDGREFERKPGLWDPLIGVAWHHEPATSWTCTRRLKAAASASAPTWKSPPAVRLDWKPATHFGITAGYNLLYFKLSHTVGDRTFTAKQTMHGPDRRHRAVLLTPLLISRLRASVLLALLLWAAPAAAAELPVLFVHGFCSSADTWNETVPQLSMRRYGDDVPRVFESAIGKAAVRTSISQEREDLPNRLLRSRQRVRSARGRQRADRAQGRRAQGGDRRDQTVHRRAER